MAQVTVYLDAETAAQMKKAARAARMSQSRWLVELIRAKTSVEWPADVQAMAGAWADAPTSESLRDTDGHDVPREDL
jgi:hypothetical protein